MSMRIYTLLTLILVALTACAPAVAGVGPVEGPGTDADIPTPSSLSE